jgi:hypothetical protein
MTRPGKAYKDPLDALGMCAINAIEFSSSMRGWGLVRVTGLTYPGREHWASLFVLTDDLSETIVRDGTMRQFNAEAPAPWKGTLDDWLDDMTELLKDHLCYECFADPATREALYEDYWIREDIVPGDNVRPWEVTA